VHSDQYIPRTETDDFFRPPPTTIEARKIVSSRVESLDIDAPVHLVPSEKCGVGITFSIDEETSVLKVLSMVENGPAARSGLVQKGSILEVVDGINVIGHPMEVVHSLLKGREGTVAHLVFCDPEDKEVTVGLVREEVPAMTHYAVPERVGVGISFETSAVDGSALVKGVVRNSPADRSGLVRVGDVLYEVDGTNVFREGLDVVANFLLGEPGTPVQMLFLRGTRIFIQVTLTREHTSRQSEMGEILIFAQSSRRIVPPGTGTIPGEPPKPHADAELQNREPVALQGYVPRMALPTK